MSDYLTTIFNRQYLQDNRRVALVTNTIIIPEYFMDKTLQVCNGAFEQAGWLICSKVLVGDLIVYTVENMWVTDTGSAASVYPSKTLNLPDTHSGIEFHSHPKALGSTWWNRFSAGDMNTLTKRMQQKVTYKHILFTPTHMLTFGRETPGIRLATINPILDVYIQEREAYWDGILNKTKS